MKTNPNKSPVDAFAPSRRTMIGACAIAAIAGAPALASMQHPDAELLRLGIELNRLLPAIAPLKAEEDKRNKIFEAEASRIGLVLWGVAWRKLRIEMGVEEAICELGAADMAIDAVTEQIRRTPSKTFAGIAVKARALRWDCMLFCEHDLTRNEQDWPEQVMTDFVDEMERLGAEEIKQS